MEAQDMSKQESQRLLWLYYTEPYLVLILDTYNIYTMHYQSTMM